MLILPLITLGIVLLSGFLIRRLLGIRKGRWGATALAVILGQSGTIGILQFITGDAIGVGPEWLPLGLTLAVTLSMLALTLIELVARPDARPRPFRIPHPVREVRGSIERSNRYAQVSAIAIRSGLLGVTGIDGPDGGSRLGRALATTFEQSGGLFVKLGQAMASQPQLVTPAIAHELTRLQDQAAPADPEAALQVLADELGPLDAVFRTFSAEPVATASIGQTYFAELLDGRPVIVKVQRPGIRRSLERDLDILARLAEMLERRAVWARTLGIKELTAGFAEATREELDFRLEAANCEAARASLDAELPMVIPGIVSEFTTSRVLVQERIPGGSIRTPAIFDDITPRRRRELADALLSVMIKDMLGGAKFHADPHAGNVFLQPDGRLGLIDFGATGRLNRFEQAGVLDLFQGLQRENPALMRSAALRLGAATTRVDTEALDRDLAQLLTRAILPGDRLNPAAIGEIVFVFRDYGISLPRSITALFRTLYTTIGTLEVISPDYDLIGGIARCSDVIESPFSSPSSLRDFAQDQVLALAPVLGRLPGDLDDVLRSLGKGELRTRVSLLSEPEDVRVLWSMLNRALLVVVGAVGLIASAILLAAQAGGSGDDGSVVLGFVGGIGFAFSSLLLLRTIVQTLRDRQPS
ncbi:ubiquinone biosynthesis protein [Frondihabitans sp. PhB188]|uniref:ABC1 kinase family protein n=1 Tax=Frondihabitans sp. PhB188 TaxID=2485200 RepID=UPI000F47F538|nr:AarF/UbiB family protein [Frondihabitans sp. PhB188]ROQ31044.1 ubiquinone biosynthesis protein [Frondihabitans sp. PhB188]